MRRVKKKGASFGVIGRELWRVTTNNAYRNSPNAHSNSNSVHLHKLELDANMFKPVSDSGRRLGGLLINQHRRLFATPFVAFSLLAFNRTHGVSLPKTLTGAPYGNAFYALLFPVLQSANLYGVAHPLGGGVSFTTNNPNAGESHE